MYCGPSLVTFNSHLKATTKARRCVIEPVSSTDDGRCTTVLPSNWLVNLNKDETAAVAPGHSGQY